MYKPLKWVIANDRVIGDFGNGNWRANSGIKDVKELDDKYIVHGYTNSVYELDKGREGISLLILDLASNLNVVTMREYMDE